MKLFMKTGKLFGLLCDLRNCERLLTLLLTLVVVGKAVFPVHGASINPRNSGSFFYFSGIPGQNNQSLETKKDSNSNNLITTQLRVEKLYNMCSKQRVRVIRKGKKGVNARGRRNGKLSTLIFENAGSGAFRIQGYHTRLYICFSKKGKLIIRKNGNKKLCQFEEHTDSEGYLRYKTADDRFDWYMGFKKNGKPLKGHSHTQRKQECFQFLKVDQTYKCRKRGENGIQHCKLVTGVDPETMTPVRHRHRHGKIWKG